MLVTLTLGAIGWGGLALLAASLLAEQPPHAGFDLDLLLRAGRRVASGLSPYDPTATAGSLQAEDLFYSYPPPVAQALTAASQLPLGLALALWGVAATGGFGLVTTALVRRVAPCLPGPASALILVAVLPYVSPYAVAALFGNLDLWLPLVYGLLALALVPPPNVDQPERWAAPSAAGIALGLATVAKLHPGVLLLWCLARGWRERRAGHRAVPQAWRVLLVAIATCAVVIALSLATGGVGVWDDYLRMLREGSGARLASPLNIGPGSQVALLVGNQAVAAPIAALVSVATLVLAGLLAWRVREPLASLALAATASLVALPVSWFHYPVALLPFAVVAWAWAQDTPRQRVVSWLLGAAAVVSGLAILAPVAVWVAVGIVLAVLLRVGRGAGERAADRPSPA